MRVRPGIRIHYGSRMAMQRKEVARPNVPVSCGGGALSSRGIAAEGILLKMLLDNGIEAEHGSPSRPGDIIVPPNVIIEIKDPNANSYSFFQHSGKGESQWKALKEKKERFPWLEIYYVVRFKRKEWRYFTFPDNTNSLHLREGLKIDHLFSILLGNQSRFAVVIWGELV